MVNLNLTVIATIFNFLLLTAILTAILYKPITRFMAERAQRIQDDMAKAEQDRSTAQKLLEEYQQKLDQLQKEIHDRLEDAVLQGEKAREDIVKGAEEEARRILSAAQDEAVRLRRDAWMKLKEDIADLATAACLKVLEDRPGQDYEEQIRRALDKIVDAGGVAR